MADGIDIDLQKVADIAEKIRLLNSDVQSCLEGIEKEIKNADVIWKSNAEVQLAIQYSNFKLKQEEFHDDLEKYAQFLIDTVTGYSSTELRIDNNANSFM